MTVRIDGLSCLQNKGITREEASIDIGDIITAKQYIYVTSSEHMCRPP